MDLSTSSLESGLWSRSNTSLPVRWTHVIKEATRAPLPRSPSIGSINIRKMKAFEAILLVNLIVAAAGNWAGNVHPKAAPHPHSQVYYATKPQPPWKDNFEFTNHHEHQPDYQELQPVYHEPQPLYHEPQPAYQEPGHKPTRPDYHSHPFQSLLKSEPAHHPPPPQARHKHSAIGGGRDTQVGSYHVLLPDGRTQTVDYHVDDAQSLVGTGFDASPLRSFRAVR